MKILLVEDDLYIVEACTDALMNDYEIDSANTLSEARNKLKKDDYNLVLLDIELPDGNGIEFIQEVRNYINIPIIFISVHDQDEIISMGLDLGADDYLIKPFSLRVLMSRIKSVMRRYYGQNSSIFNVDTEKRIVKKNNQMIELTSTEFDLFALIFNAKGRILTRRYLLETIWDNKGDFVEDNTLTVTIKRLKNKIGNEYIQTKRNVGYYFKEV